MTPRSRASRMRAPPIFVYDGEPYMRITPCKNLFRSTTVYEVVNRGDFFAVNMNTGVFTILKGGSDEKLEGD